MVKGSDLLVAPLGNEGVDRIFGIPGEENPGPGALRFSTGAAYALLGAMPMILIWSLLSLASK
jgi:acetolactate synthase-1/2/3 large subunit